MQMSPYASQLAESAEMDRFLFTRISVKNGIKAGLFQNFSHGLGFTVKGNPSLRFSKSVPSR